MGKSSEKSCVDCIIRRSTMNKGNCKYQICIYGKMTIYSSVVLVIK